MEKLPFKLMLLLMTGILSMMSTWSQTTPDGQYEVTVYPADPKPTDSVYVAYTYVSGDACPDYFLAIDSTAQNQVFIVKKRLQSTGMCAQVISKFRTSINLGTVTDSTRIYFDGALIKTIRVAGCIMDRMGMVTQTLNNASIVKENSSGELFEIRDNRLPAGTIIKFKGTKIQCITTPCYNIVDCYAIGETPPPACPLDKVGLVVAGIDGCSGKLFIEDTRVMSAYPQLYTIGGTANINLKAGDRVKFGGYLTKNDSSDITLCRTVGVATCYELQDSTKCIYDKKGVIVNCSGQVFIQEYSPVSSMRQLYAIKTQTGGLKEGMEVLFGGYYLREDSDTATTCRTVGVATCYELRNTPPPPTCIMDKKGVVVTGIDGCTGELFVREITITADAVLRLYKLRDATALKPGDKIQFGSIPVSRDSLSINLCPVAGVVTCYERLLPTQTFSLGGKVMAGGGLMKSGTAILYVRNNHKAIASYTITDGTFMFTDLHPAEYTIYVIPDISLYGNYLPTYYVNKLYFRNSDYITLNDNIGYLAVELKQNKVPAGTGRIYGNIYFENTTLKDTVMAESSLRKVSAPVAPDIAVNIPVLLLNTAGEAIAWTLTDAYGNYAFENIALGNYKVFSETAAAIAENPVILTPGNSTANADLMLKSQQEATGLPGMDKKSIHIYPNPVSDYLSITLEESTKMSIYSATGQMMLQQDLIPGKNVVNVKNMNKGLLFVKIGNSTYKLIKE